MTTEKEKMLAGLLADSASPELVADRALAAAWLRDYNAAESLQQQRALLERHLAMVGERAVIRPPFRCDFGYNISVGPMPSSISTASSSTSRTSKSAGERRLGRRCRSMPLSIRAMR